LKLTLTPVVLVATIGTLWSTPTGAQVRARGGVRVAPRTRAVVVVGGGYGRPFYRPYYRPFYSPFYSPFYFDPFYGPYYPPFYWSSQVYGGRFYDGEASLRLQVSPRETEVYIDSYYAGTVDDFDGIFQRLHIEAGSHDVTLYLDGHRTVHQRIYLQPTGTFRLRYTMQPLGAGEVAEPRPVQPAQPPQPQGAPPGPPGGPGSYPPLPPRSGPFPPPQGPPPGPPQGARSDAGTLAVRVQPAGADVLIDGERWQGPSGDERLVVDVSPGRHHIEVRRDGYRTYQSDVDVRPGETTTLNVSLSRP
jgi:PEGA domain-containing protein